ILEWVALLWILALAKARSAAPISAAISAKRATPNAFGAKINAPWRARGGRAAGCVARSLQPAAGMRLTRSLPSALLPLRATHSSISTVSQGRLIPHVKTGTDRVPADDAY